jgi:hypothetical protein
MKSPVLLVGNFLSSTSGIMTSVMILLRLAQTDRWLLRRKSGILWLASLTCSLAVENSWGRY